MIIGSVFTATDSNGRYSLTMSTPGVYEIDAIASGFVRGKVSVNVSLDATVVRNFALMKALPGVIAGNVVDGYDGSPISNATVVAGLISTKTDPGGKYMLANVPSDGYGEVYIKADVVGYVQQWQLVQVIGGQTVQANFALMHRPLDPGGHWPPQ